jgi:hypothetical protein
MTKHEPRKLSGMTKPNDEWVGRRGFLSLFIWTLIGHWDFVIGHFPRLIALAKINDRAYRISSPIGA